MTLEVTDFTRDTADFWLRGKLRRIPIFRYGLFATREMPFSYYVVERWPDIAKTENWDILHIPTGASITNPGFPSFEAAADVIGTVIKLRNDWEISPNDMSAEFSEKFGDTLKELYVKYRPEYAKTLQNFKITNEIKQVTAAHPKINGYDTTPMEKEGM